MPAHRMTLVAFRVLLVNMTLTEPKKMGRARGELMRIQRKLETEKMSA